MGHMDHRPILALALLLGACAPGKSTGGTSTTSYPIDDGGTTAWPDMTVYYDQGTACGYGLSCICQAGSTRPCYTGSPQTRQKGQCTDGIETCDTSGLKWSRCDGEVLPSVEVCDDKIDNDCDGKVDEGCIVSVPIKGDCSTVSCPATAPFPVGCNVNMGGSDCTACVANSTGSSKVFFKEGIQCDAGVSVTGYLFCSSEPSSGLDESNCTINKKKKSFVMVSGACPLSADDGCNPSCSPIFCGTSSPVPGSNPQCYCDSLCTDNGDCCPGYTTACGR